MNANALERASSTINLIRRDRMGRKAR